MDAVMIGGTLIGNKFIKNMEKDKLQIFVSILFCVVGTYMLNSRT
jgi:uncharacterized membrane protein YfcA